VLVSVNCRATPGCSDGPGSANAGGSSFEVGTDPDSVMPFGFGGRHIDSTRFIYLVNRYYDPATGQFLSVDPMVGSTGTPYA